MNYGAWESPIYRQTVLIVLGIIFLSGFIVFLFRRKTHYFTFSWASIKSWLIAAPLLFGVIGAPEPWPLVILTLIAIIGAKIFFQIFGMYQKALFVWCCYGGIVALAFCVNTNNIVTYNLMPMIVLGTMCLIPIIRNDFHRMIQYTSLSLLAFVFMGWSFMHLGLILKFEKGIYQLMYLIILTEFCDNTTLALSRSLGSTQIASHINPKRYIESTVVSILLTIALASIMRFLLPDNSENYWFASGLIAALGGGIGDLVMTVIRRDLGIRDYGAFIIGRGDFLHRMDRLIFVAPIYYYFMLLSH
jgi:phosphatidate cytidylyltransferase